MVEKADDSRKSNGAEKQAGERMTASPKTSASPKTVVGEVVSDKMQKTISVRVLRLERHRRYHKYVRRRATYKAHDHREEARIGDLVRIAETRPLSKTKNWRLVEVVKRAGAVPVGGPGGDSEVEERAT